MPNPEEIEQVIERTIKIYLQQEGSKDVANGMKSVKAEVDKVRKAAKDLGGEVIDLNKEMRNLAKAHVAAEKAASAALKKQIAQVGKVAKSFTNLGGAVSSAFGEIGSGLKKIAGLSGFGAMVNEAVSYDKTLLNLSASTNRLGIGITQLETKMISIGSATQLTRKETMSLFSEFNKSYKFVSLRDFESLLGRVQSMVGSNKDAIQEYLSAVSGLSQNYSGLAQSIAKIGKGGAFEDKESAARRLKMLYLTRKIGDVEYRNLIAVVKGNQQVTKLDRERQKAAKDRIETIQKFQRHIENIGIRIGQTLLPFLEKVADFLEDITESGAKWGRGVAATVALLAGVKLGGGLLSMGGGAIASGLATKAAGGAFLPGAAAAGGGVALAGAGVLAGGAVAAGGDWGYRSLREKAHEKKMRGEGAVGTQMASRATGIGGYAAGGALAGAAIGSVVPVIGTAIGAAVGGLAGGIIGTARVVLGDMAYEKEKEAEAKHLSKISGMSSSITSRRRKELTGEMGYSKDLERSVREGGEEGRAAKTAGAQLKILETYKRQTSQLKERELAAYGGQGAKAKLQEEIKFADEKVAKEKNLQALLQSDYSKAKGAGKDDEAEAIKMSIEGQVKAIGKAEEEAQRLKDVQNGIEDSLRSQNVEYAKADAAMTAMLENQREMAEFADKAGQLKEAELSRLNTEVERMRLTGDVDVGKLAGFGARAFQAIDAEKESLGAYLSSLKMVQNARKEGMSLEGMDMKDIGGALGFSPAQSKVLEDLNINAADMLDTEASIVKVEDQIAKKTEDRLKAVEAINTAFQGQIALAGAVAEKASLMVQIADSYAMGVGASAQMRMQEFNAIEQQRMEMERQLQVQIEALNNMKEGDARQKQAETVEKTENNILQLQLKQAGITKSLRDGWIEAIGSMNTGAGTFSKIVMDQNKGTAQSLKLAGQAAVISSRSGALGGGYRTSEKFSAMQGVAGQGLITGAMGKRTQAYQTTMDQLTGTNIEGVQYKHRRQLQQRLTAQNRQATAGGLQSLGFAASKHYEGIVGEEGVPSSFGSGLAPPSATAAATMSDSSGTINVNVNIRANSEKVGQDIAKQIVPELQVIFNNITADTLDGVALP